MNILLISPLPPPAGGMASWTKKYLESKTANENKIHLVNTAVIGKRVNEYYKRKLYLEIIRMLNIILDLKKQLYQNKIDAAHLNCACGRFGSLIKDYVFASIVKNRNVRLIVHFHCDVTDMAIRKTDLFFLKKIVKKSDAILTLNERSRKFINHFCRKQSVCIPNFLSDESFCISESKAIEVSDRFAGREKEKDDTIRSVLFVGRIEREKGCDLIYQLARRFPHIQFVLLGYISESFRILEKPENLILYGEVSHSKVITEMYKADLLLFPSLTEGFPYAVMEAMACELPVIATPVGAIPDMIEKEGGILIPVDDVDAAAEAICLLQDRNLRDKMAVWNRKKVLRSYTADHVMSRLFELYHSA